MAAQLYLLSTHLVVYGNGLFGLAATAEVRDPLQPFLAKGQR